ncbi:MAG TPA: STAS domain-containing protein [Polyangia bacterium]
MKVLVDLTEGTLNIRIMGELDAVSVPTLRAAVDPLVEDAQAGVVVDIAGLRLIDSSGVGALVGLFRRLKATGRRFAVQGATEQPLTILKLMKLDRVFAEAGTGGG